MTKNHLINLTPTALKRLSEILSKEKNKGKSFRIKIIGGGCAGFQYQFSIDKPAQDDTLYSYDDGYNFNITLLIDPASQPFLKGATLDYKEELIGSAFQINNPNSEMACSCGSSFSI